MSVDMCAWWLERVEEGLGSAGMVTNGCEPPWVLWKSSQCWQLLNHLSSPSLYMFIKSASPSTDEMTKEMDRAGGHTLRV